MSLLEVRSLAVGFPGPRGEWHRPVASVDLGVAPGEAVALVGASGSGKSLTALALVGLLPPRGRILAGSVHFDGTDLTAAPAHVLTQVRGRRIGMVFQDPLASLNPVRTIGGQLCEVIAAHRTLPDDDARTEACRLLEAVGLGSDPVRLGAWPHQLSGGQRQRALLAMALAGEPDLLVADEPTSALDTSVQAEILTLLATLRRERGLALLLITHDLAVAGTQADRILVMEHGRIVEHGPVVEVLTNPRHAYTRALVDAVPRLPEPTP